MAKDLLKEYNKKRDFKLTKEPSGKLVKKKTKKLVFVVQEHHARSLHYDFRLELESVLKSWAVPKGPSLDPADKRLAVQTEDHPMGYEKFHGTIPQGEYGGGEVFIWDKGTWEPESDDPIGDIKRGELKFKLKGKKLKGSFVLVRTNWKGNKNWLLIKHKEESKESVKKKSSPVGRDPWPSFILPELPRLVDSVPDVQNLVHEMKLDGYRMQGHVRDNLATFWSRNRLNWSNKFPFILNGLEELSLTNAIFDGEVVALDDEGRPDFQLLQNSIKAKNDKRLRYYIFDLLYLNGEDLRELPLIERKERLAAILKGAKSQIVYSEHFQTNGADFFELACQHKLEGIISKKMDAPYVSGRSDLWVKVKCTNRQEFVIGGWSDPKGGRQGIGALMLGVHEEGQLRYIGRVGTGFNHDSLKQIKNELSQIEIEKSPFDLKSPKAKDIHWVEPIKLCEVSFSEWTKEGILRTPVFLGMREDKKAEEISMDKAKKVREISSPDKILFKKEGITKQDVSDYYQTVAKLMLPYIKDRPLSLVRCPQGSSGECFYQKHINGNIPDSFQTVSVEEEKGEGIYVSVDSPQGIQELVQINAYEIHAWNSHRDSYLNPDQIVMDLDPGPGVSWKEVVEAAFEIKEMLADLELESFVKVTGGKGLHIHVPILPLYDWDEVKSFAQSLALELVHRKPKKYVANMAKKLRHKKIFVDYLRNGQGATAVVPYSLRAKDKSAVALPLDWTELKRLKGPEEFSLPRALKKIKARRKDPWARMLKLKQRIAILTQASKKKAA